MRPLQHLPLHVGQTLGLFAPSPCPPSSSGQTYASVILQERAMPRLPLLLQDGPRLPFIFRRGMKSALAPGPQLYTNSRRGSSPRLPFGSKLGQAHFFSSVSGGVKPTYPLELQDQAMSRSPLQVQERPAHASLPAPD